MKIEHIREKCRETLFTPIHLWGRIISTLIAIIIILSIALIPLYFIPQLEWAKPWFLLFEVIAVIVFSIEYLLRIWSSKKPIKYIFSWLGIIDLAVIIPFYLQLIGMITDAQYFLLLLILQILKLGRIYYSERTSTVNIAKKSHGTFHSMDDEVIEQVAQKHPIVFFIALIPPLISTSLALFILLIFKGAPLAIAFSVLFLIFSVLFFIKAWLDFHYDVIYITNHRVILQNRQLLGTRINDIVYEAITNIRPDNTGILNFFFGFGDIQIETAASSGNRTFTDVSNPHKVVEYISNNRQKALASGGSPSMYKKKRLKKEKNGRSKIMDIIDSVEEK